MAARRVGFQLAALLHSHGRSSGPRLSLLPSVVAYSSKNKAAPFPIPKTPPVSVERTGCPDLRLHAKKHVLYQCSLLLPGYTLLTARRGLISEPTRDITPRTCLQTLHSAPSSILPAIYSRLTLLAKKFSALVQYCTGTRQNGRPQPASRRHQQARAGPSTARSRHLVPRVKHPAMAICIPLCRVRYLLYKFLS